MGKQPWSRYGVPSNRILWNSSRLCFQTVNQFPTVSQIQYSELVDHKLTDHRYKAQAEGIQDILWFQWPILWSHNFLYHCENGAPRHTFRLIRHQDKTGSQMPHFNQDVPKVNLKLRNGRTKYPFKILMQKFNLYSSSSCPKFRFYIYTREIKWEEDKEF